MLELSTNPKEYLRQAWLDWSWVDWLNLIFFAATMRAFMHFHATSIAPHPQLLPVYATHKMQWLDSFRETMAVCGVCGHTGAGACDEATRFD